ncbi:type II CAAX endopeptidase family protein [uncultured Dokdonia sp.]|uniref:CPBP family intramembrane glutamic endopeptidase n=1 Tax=uncultured Dokdonia sp. TaxID=575653 RepID=UPI00260DCEB2|nr:type II CAAX endopeptidase family protein [uncultured Dokdonia sp.]
MYSIKNINPFITSLGLIILITIIFSLPIDALFSDDYFSEFQIEYIILTLKMSSLFVIAFIGIKKVAILSLSGLSPKNPWSFKLLNVIPIYLFALGILSFIGNDLTHIQISNVILLFIACMAVGFAEEFIFRGLLVPLFIKKYRYHRKGIFLSIFFSALFFGLSHLINLSVNENVPQVIAQVIFATFMGIFFASILLKTNKLIPIAITHGLINFFFLFGTLPAINSNSEVTTQSLSEQIAEAIPSILLFLPLLIVGLIISRKINRDRTLKKLPAQGNQKVIKL